MASTVFKSVDQLAFNVSLVAYDHGITDKPPRQRLGFKEIKRNKKFAELKDDEYIVPPPTPSPQELSIDQTEIVGVWVGMRPSGAAKYTTKAAEEKTTKGKSINTLGIKCGYTLIATDPKALRVVVPMDKETASYYALADQDASGLCSGLGVSITEVFFFPEFRNDDLTDTSKRKSEWSELVRKVSNPVGKITFSKHYDKTKFRISPRRALSNELSTLVGTYIEGGDTSVLRSAIELIDRADTDGAVTPPPSNLSLAKFAASTTKMTNEECMAALSELMTLSPALKDLNITSQDLQCISAAIVGSRIALPYAHTRAFIVQFVSELRDGKCDAKKEADLNAAAVRCSTHVMYQLGGKPAFVDRQGDPDGLRAIFDGQKKKLQDFKGYIHESIQALKDSQGDSAVSTAPTLPQLWSKYGVSPDLDSAKLYALGIHRHNVEALSAILEPLEVMLDKNAEQLEKLKASIAIAETEKIQEG